MGGGKEVKFEMEGFYDVENTVFVAVGKNAKESKMTLLWTLQNLPGKKICLLHVHQPPSLVSLMDGKFSTGKLAQLVAKAYLELERQKMHKLLNQYLFFLAQVGAGKLWVEMEDIEKGIVQIIIQHGIRRLVMGAAAEKHFSQEMSDLKSSKASFVSQQAPAFCHIWFVCKGCIVQIRGRSFNTSSHLESVVALATQVFTNGETSLNDHATSDKDLDHSDMSVDKVGVDRLKSNPAPMYETRGNFPPLSSQIKSLDHLFHSLSVCSLGEKYQGAEDLHDKLEHAMIGAERSEEKAFEESMKGWKSEEDALEATSNAERLENLCVKEINHRREIEEMLTGQKKEVERIKHQHDQFIEELQLVHNQKLALMCRVTEAHKTEKELEDKIIQAAHLLVSFRQKRDELQIEHEKAVGEVKRLWKLIKDDLGSQNLQFFFCSFADIIEATNNFDPSSKIAEGRFGSMYKGLLFHMKVAIKMLPSGGCLSDAEFEHEVGVMSRVRHPNLVALIGICPESRSLIYEYLENGSLKDCLPCRGNSPSLSWEIRIRIAIEICSTLIFLHSNKPPIVHGHLTLTKVLLDINFVSKVSDLGMCHFLPHDANLLRGTLFNKNDPETVAYMDPECLDGQEITAESDVYSFGIILLQLLTGRPALGLVKDVKCALEAENLLTQLDTSAGDWPFELAKLIAHLALRCCEKKRSDRPDLVSDVWNVIEPMRNLCVSSSEHSKAHYKTPSHFLCPIYQEVMTDPYIAADGFTYEADAIGGWLNSGHDTSPMTNLKLEHCDLLPNYALYYAIQAWQKQS